MEDTLHLPPWNTGWYLKEVRKDQIRGAVHLILGRCTQAVQASFLIRKTFEEAGIPVLELRADTVHARDSDDAPMTSELEAFVENRLGVKQ